MIDLVHTHLPRLAAPLLPGVRWRVPTEERVCYLTFDDGPTAHTPALLDLLDRHDAPALHFLIGERAERYPEHVRALIERGHAVGNHTYTHVDAWRTRPARLAAELDRTAEVIAQQTGQQPEGVRPPYGHLTPGLIRWSRRHGQRVVMWDTMPADFRADQSADAIAARTERLLRPGTILVLHDNPDCAVRTQAALALLLPRLRDQGWRFERLRSTV